MFPQGSVLSVTKFANKINSIVSCLYLNRAGSLHVYDFSISCQSKNIDFIERQLQECINCLEDLLPLIVSISPLPRLCMRFCQLRCLHLHPTLFLKSKVYPAVPDRVLLLILSYALNSTLNISLMNVLQLL